ncbi:MAG: formylglycine-generating enzyme family protein [Anaerolineales bacterium]|nr:formylglycine-generating enzyme family protein [Anaerolineales bacterium]
MKKFIPFLLLALIALTGCGPAPDVGAVTPPEYIDTEIDPDSWVTVSAGEFLSGQHENPVNLDYDYQIMVTDVTNQQYADFLNQALEEGAVEIGEVFVRESENVKVLRGVHGPYPGDPFDGYEHEEEIEPGEKLHFPLEENGVRITLQEGEFASIPEYSNHPVTMVTWFGAQAYCEYYGWRLPLELEWEKAARGTDQEGEYARAFPWGSEIEGNYANYYSSFDLFEKIFGKLGNTTPVGFYNGGTYAGYQTQDQASPYGLYDMAGNIWQWMGNDYPRQHYRYLRGGSFYSYEVDLRVWKRNSAGPSYYAPDVGFRCVQNTNG